MNTTVLKYEYFSIKNREGAIRSKKEEEKFQEELKKVESKIRQLPRTKRENLIAEVKKMLNP